LNSLKNMVNIPRAYARRISEDCLK